MVENLWVHVDVCAFCHSFMVKYSLDIKENLQHEFFISKWPHPPPPPVNFPKMAPYWESRIPLIIKTWYPGGYLKLLNKTLTIAVVVEMVTLAHFMQHPHSSKAYCPLSQHEGGSGHWKQIHLLLNGKCGDLHNAGKHILPTLAARRWLRTLKNYLFSN